MLYFQVRYAINILFNSVLFLSYIPHCHTRFLNILYRQMLPILRGGLTNKGIDNFIGNHRN